ncbi:tyrosine-type recombinase/integrase [Alicycliphilus sp. T452]|jgi:site-specific recombinase XerD
MKLSQAVTSYVAYKQAMGLKFHREARVLNAYCTHMGSVEMSQVGADQTRHFIVGSGPITRTALGKYAVLSRFYRYAMTRGHADGSPLPAAPPKLGKDFVPYIYSRQDLRRLLDTTDEIDQPKNLIDPGTYRTLLLLLYGTGLRISEALHLTMADVDLSEAVLHIHGSKFYKSRLVPIGTDVEGVLRRYLARRVQCQPVGPESPFLLSRLAGPISLSAAEHTFVRLRRRAGILRDGGPRAQPRLHDLRHTFAVHRLTAWYRSGNDGQSLLLQLSVYLGHVDIGSTQPYLTLTPELLRAASARFEAYAMEESHA